MKTYLATKDEVVIIASDLATIETQINQSTTGIDARLTAVETGGGTVIIDNLSSTSVNAALSANQGKVLNEKFTPLNVLTSTDTTKTLSAAQGKALKDLITDLQTLGTRLTTNATDTLTSLAEEDVLTLTLPQGKWMLFGSVAVNQSNTESASDYICGVMTTNPTAYTSQEVFASNVDSVIGRMSSGADLAMTFPPRYYSSGGAVLITMRLISSFTTEASTVKSAMTAIKIGI